MTIEICAFEEGHYPRARALWEGTDGVGLSSADERPAIERFLNRNPKLSLVAFKDGRLIGTILVGHDGRRGLIHHLAVAPAERRQGIGLRLVREALAGLARADIEKCHMLVFITNSDAQAFWASVGAEHRQSITIYSLPTSNPPRSDDCGVR